MKMLLAPDLGLPFKPSFSLLLKLARHKSKIILTTLKKNKFTLLLPYPPHLPNYLIKRMKEQGRFAALKVETASNAAGEDGQVFFMKFPLGGKSARDISKREYALYQFVNALEHETIVRRHVELLKTPFGFGLMTPFYEGVRLQHAKKTDKLEQIANLIYSLQTLLDNRNFSTKLVRDPMLYNSMTHPIHSFALYKKEIEDRVKILPKNLANRILTTVNKMALAIKKFQGIPVFSHRDFFDKNIILLDSDKSEIQIKSDESDNQINRIYQKNQIFRYSDVPTSDVSGIPINPIFRPLVLVDFEHSAIIKNYILGLNFDLANLIVQWYRFPGLTKKITQLVRQKHRDKKIFDFSLRVCLIIQILAKIDPVAQTMHPGGADENLKLLKNII